MKILLLCNKLPYPANDGSSIAMAKMIEGFLENGATVSAFCINTKKHFKSFESTPAGIAQKVNFNIATLDTTPTPSGAIANLFSPLPFHVSRFYNAELAQQLRDILLQNTFDVVQIEGVFMMPYFDIVRKNSDAKIALRTHNVEHKIWQRIVKNTRNPILKTFLKWQVKKLKKYEQNCAQKADAVVAISQKDATFFERINMNTSAIPCGIDENLNAKNIVPKSFFHLGAMDWLPNQQGIDWLLEKVWPKVVAKNKNVQLHLAGRQMSEALLHKKMPQLTVHGEVKDATEFREKHGIMLVPLLAGSGIRIKIIEGLAEGIPIIATQIGAEGIDAENGKEIIIANSEEEFANAMIHLAENPEKCSAIGKNAALLARKKFSNKTLLKRLLAFYKNTWQTS